MMKEQNLGVYNIPMGMRNDVLPKEKHVPSTLHATQTRDEKKTCLLYEMKDNCYKTPSLPVIMNETRCTDKTILEKCLDI